MPSGVVQTLGGMERSTHHALPGGNLPSRVELVFLFFTYLLRAWMLAPSMASMLNHVE